MAERERDKDQLDTKGERERGRQIELIIIAEKTN